MSATDFAALTEQVQGLKIELELRDSRTHLSIGVLAARVDRIENSLDRNTASTTRVEANTKELIDIWGDMKGAARVVVFLAKVSSVGGACVAAFLGIKFYIVSHIQNWFK